MMKYILKCLWFLIVLDAVCETKQTRLKIVIDQDGGADDAMAIFMCILNEGYYNGPELVALTTVHGNVNESQVYVNSQRILNIAQRKDIPIYRGCRSSFISSIESDYFFGLDGLGDNQIEDYEELPAQPVHAAMALIELSKLFAGELIVVAIGSLTNIALAVKLDPHFISRLAHLYIGAGHIYSKEFNEPEFNAAMDPEAYYMAVNGSEPHQLTMVPFSSVKNSVNINKSWRLNVLGALPTIVMRYMNKFERLSLAAVQYWNILDPAVMAIVLQESIVDEWRDSLTSVNLCDPDRGLTPHEFSSEKPNARVLIALNEERYKTFLYKIFSSPLRSTNDLY